LTSIFALCLYAREENPNILLASTYLAGSIEKILVRVKDEKKHTDYRGSGFRRLSSD